MNTRGSDPDDIFDFEDPDDDMFARRERERTRSPRPGVSDFVRRAFDTVGSTGSISREAFTYLLQQGDRGKREVVRIVAKEVGDFLRQTDISSEVVKILTGVQVEFTASIKFKPTADGRAVRPELGAEPSVRVTDGEGRDYLDEEDEPELRDREPDLSRDQEP